MTNNVVSDTTGGVLTLTLDRPEKKNAITEAMYGALADGLEHAASNPEIRCVLLLSNGDSFTAGNDISTFAQAAKPDMSDDRLNAPRFLRGLASASKPVVAGVRGQAIGVGLTMLLHCDLVIVAGDACLSAPFVSLGLVPEAASSILLVQRLGHARAFAIFAGAAAMTGDQAVAWGVANRAMASAQVDAAAREAASLLASRPAGALVTTKLLLRDSAALLARIEEEGRHFAAALRSPEAQAAFAAFAARRVPASPQVT